MNTIELAKDLGQGIYTKEETDTKIQTDAPVPIMTTEVGDELVLNNNMVPENSEVSLGTLEKPFRDVFISESSLYVNGQKVLSEESGTINISADDNQNVRISTGGAGDIEFLPTGSGNINLKGTVSMLAGEKIISSDGNAIVIDEDLNVQVISSPTITLLNGRLQSLETLTTSDDINIDTIQEIVDFIKANRSDLESIVLDWDSIANIPATFTPEAHTHSVNDTLGLQDNLDSKVDNSRVLTDVPANALFTDTNTIYSKPTSEPISYVSGLQTALDSKANQDTTYTKSELGTSNDFNSAFDTAIS